MTWNAEAVLSLEVLKRIQAQMHDLASQSKLEEERSDWRWCLRELNLLLCSYKSILPSNTAVNEFFDIQFSNFILKFTILKRGSCMGIRKVSGREASVAK